MFRARLFRMMYFWLLKSSEISFYETEASFIFPLLEMVRLNIGYITNSS